MKLALAAAAALLITAGVSNARALHADTWPSFYPTGTYGGPTGGSGYTSLATPTVTLPPPFPYPTGADYGDDGDDGDYGDDDGYETTTVEPYPSAGYGSYTPVSWSPVSPPPFPVTTGNSTTPYMPTSTSFTIITTIITTKETTTETSFTVPPPISAGPFPTGNTTSFTVPPPISTSPATTGNITTTVSSFTLPPPISTSPVTTGNTTTSTTYSVTPPFTTSFFTTTYTPPYTTPAIYYKRSPEKFSTWGHNTTFPKPTNTYKIPTTYTPPFTTPASYYKRNPETFSTWGYNATYPKPTNTYKIPKPEATKDGIFPFPSTYPAYTGYSRRWWKGK